MNYTLWFSPRGNENRRSKIVPTNGIPAGQLDGVIWQKSRRSNPSGNCVEVALLPTGEVAVRNSADPEGPALIYTPAEIEAFIGGVRDGDFDNLLHR